MTLARGVLLAVVLLVALVALLWLGQRRLLYLPDRAVPGPPPPGARAVTLHTADGLELGAWLLPPPAAGATVLVANGNAGNRGDRLMLANRLSAEGLGVLLFDYRGYGGNPGSPSEAGLALDARAARDFLLDGAGVRPERLVYLGESLGAAVVTRLALQNPAPAGVVLRSPFTSLGDVARAVYGIVPDALLRDRYPLAEQVVDVDAPVHVVAGERDAIVPLAQSRQVAEAAGAPLTVVPDAGHNDPQLAAGDPLVAAVRDATGPADGTLSPDEPGDVMSDGDWYWCLEHQQVEQGATCPDKQRMGPYPSREAAANWRDTVESRNERWDAEDERWER